MRYIHWEKADIGFRAMSDGANEKRVDNAEFMRAVEQPSAGVNGLMLYSSPSSVCKSCCPG
jgi:hypothetical protein